MLPFLPSFTAPSSSLLHQLLSTLRHPVTSLSLSLSPVLFPTLVLSLAPPSSIALLIALTPPLHPSSSSGSHHFSFLSPSAYFEALLLDLIWAPSCSLPSSEFRIYEGEVLDFPPFFPLHPFLPISSFPLPDGLTFFFRACLCPKGIAQPYQTQISGTSNTEGTV